MRTMIEDLKLYLQADTENLSPQVDTLIQKNYLYNIEQYSSGTQKFAAGDTSSAISISGANYVYLVSDDKFVVTIDTLTLSTRHFTYLNDDEPIEISVSNDADNEEDIEVKYVSGQYTED